MTPLRRTPDLPTSLSLDARDEALPRTPPFGFRNMFHEHEAEEADRWQGLGDAEQTALMLSALAERMVARPPLRADSPFPAGFTYLAQFMAHDLQFSTSERHAAGAEVPEVAFRRRRLALETLYGLGPDGSPQFYGAGDDDLAPWRLRFGRFGGDAPLGQRTLPRDAACRTVSGDPALPLCAADDRNDENPVVAQIAGVFLRLHNVALRRLSRYADPAERFAAARRVTQRVYRRMIFDDLLPRLLRADVRAVYENGLRRDACAAAVDDMPVEFSHAAIRAAHALVRPDYAVSPSVNNGLAINVRDMIRHTSKRDPEAFRTGRAWAVDWRLFFGDGAQGAEPLAPHVNPFLADAPTMLTREFPLARRANLPLRDLLRGMTAGVLRVKAVAEALAPAFPEAVASERWLAFDASQRGAALLDFLGDAREFAPWRDEICGDPPLYLFTLIEAAAPADQGGGEGRRFGALGSALIAETLYAARDGNAAAIEGACDADRDEAAVFGPAAPPRDMQRLIAVLIPQE